MNDLYSRTLLGVLLVANLAFTALMANATNLFQEVTLTDMGFAGMIVLADLVALIPKFSIPKLADIVFVQG